MNRMLKILLVEDEKKIADALQKGLSEQHFFVETAYDGSRGKELFDQGDFDLVILDIGLPGINGYDLCRLIREKNEKIPIIMLTALDTTDDKIVGFEAGADDYIIKPFDFKELL